MIKRFFIWLLKVLGWLLYVFIIFSVIETAVWTLMPDSIPAELEKVVQVIASLLFALLLILGILYVKKQIRKAFDQHCEELEHLHITDTDSMLMLKHSRFHINGYWILRMLMNGSASRCMATVGRKSKLRQVNGLQLSEDFQQSVLRSSHTDNPSDPMVLFFQHMKEDKLNQPFPLTDLLSGYHSLSAFSSPDVQQTAARFRRVPISATAVWLLVVVLGITLFFSIFMKTSAGFLMGLPILAGFLTVLHTFRLMPIWAENNWKKYLQQLLEAQTIMPEDELLRRVGRPDASFSEAEQEQILRAYCVYYDRLAALKEPDGTPSFIATLIWTIHTLEEEERKRMEAD